MCWLFVAALSTLGAVLACSSAESPSAGSASEVGGAGSATGGARTSSGGAASAAGGLGNGTSASGGVRSAGGSGSIGGSTASGGDSNAGGANSGGSSTMGTGGAPVITEPGSKNWVYIMLGQSNMQGASPLEAEDNVAPARVFKLKQDKTWVPASEDVCLWGGGLSPSRTFGMKILEKVTDPEVNIYLINAAVGGTPIETWNPTNGEHYLAMLPYLEAGMQMGTVRGFIWHQGESNTDTSTADYAQKLTELVLAIRTKVGDPTLPVVAGEIGENGEDNAVNAALAQIAVSDARFKVSSSQGLTLIQGDPHYVSASERLMGEKMATAWWSILGK